jgi:hypothetical protein
VYLHSDSYDRTGFLTTGGEIHFDDAGALLTDVSLHAQADSLGGPGFIAGHTYAQILGTHTDASTPSIFTVSSNSYVTAQFSDVVVSGPPGGFVTTQINFHLSGGFINGTTLAPGASTAANNFLGVNVLVNGVSRGTGTYYYVSQDGSPPAEYLSSGWLANAFSGTRGLVSDLFQVEVGVPFTVELALQDAAQVSGPINRGLVVDANTDFASTFCFATDQPVFALPDGYTVNSADAGITNNTFVLPEPGTLALLAIGALAIRRRLRRAC